MKQYEVRVPFTGWISKTVKAENPEKALKKFHEQVETQVDGNHDNHYFESHYEVCTGEVFHGQLKKVEIKEI